MYVGRYEGQDWGEAAVVTVRGPHIDDERAALSVSWTELERFAESPEEMLGSAAFGGAVWEEAGVSRPLLAHALREAAASDFLGATEPERWSPLGDVRPEWLARFIGLDGVIDAGPEGNRPRLTREIFNQSDMVRGPVVGYAEAGLGLGALGVAWDGFIAPLPSGRTSLEVRFDEESSPDRMPNLADVLAAAPLADPDEVIFWRIYTGTNSLVRDFVTSAKDGAHRVVRGAQQGGAVVVGRILRVAAGRTDSTRGDPLARGRLLEAELADRATAQACPDIDEDVTRREVAVVVVHGTMSTGMALARAVRELAPDGIAVLRYEHDTWLPLESNAQDLANLVSLRVSSSVMLVAHSRGGLVATRAEQILRKTAPGRVGGVVTLGTPFAGTPLAMGATLGASAARALIGGLRMIGGPVVDAGTRLLPIAVRFDPPPGITVMRPRAGELPLLWLFLCPPPLGGGGAAPPASQDSHGPWSQGVASGALGHTGHDLVVSVDSALGDRGDGVVVECDHYSYLLDVGVRTQLQQSLRSFAAARKPVPSEGDRDEPQGDELPW